MTFLFFGVGLAVPAVTEATWGTVLYVALSLTIVRMIPVALALVGTHCAPATAAFLGWFGPRGLASILFALVIVDEANLMSETRILNTVSLAVLASVFLHGITARKGSDLYAARAAEMPAAMPEMQAVTMLPETRRGGWFGNWSRHNR
jgi:NhaP-type Na+/H+ or K+/H+ antiporter